MCHGEIVRILNLVSLCYRHPDDGHGFLDPCYWIHVSLSRLKEVRISSDQ